jgi:hypothetical protein
MPRIHRFAYLAPTKIDAARGVDDEWDVPGPSEPHARTPQVHMLRDGDAFAELLPVLLRGGYEYGGVEINFPTEESLKERRGLDARSRLTRGSLLVLNNRPPIGDEDVVKKIRRSHSWLEDQLFEVLGRFFEKCSRAEVGLSESLSNLLPENYQDRAKATFGLRSRAVYKQLARYGTPYGEPRRYLRTAAYMIYQKEIWEGGPDLLCAFGLSGPLNLVWAYLLRTRYPEKLAFDRGKFLMAEIKTADFPAAPPTLSFADEWEVRFPLEVELP